MIGKNETQTIEIIINSTFKIFINFLITLTHITFSSIEYDQHIDLLYNKQDKKKSFDIMENLKTFIYII